MPRRTVANTPNPSVNTADQDLDTAISPAPNDQPARPTALKTKERLVKKSVERGVFVTVAREGAVNGRTHTGKLVQVEDGPAAEGSDTPTARYAIRTGQPGRPLVVTLADIRTITEATPDTSASEDSDS